MTEAEWLACPEPRAMLRCCEGLMSDRKKQLYLVACCRSIWDAIGDDRSRQTVLVAERFADGLASDGDLSDAYVTAKGLSDAAWYFIYDNPASPDLNLLAKAANGLVAATNAASREWHFNAGPNAAWACGNSDSAACVEELGRQSNALRCLIGNPVIPVAIALDWLTPTVVSLAQAAYEDRIMPSGQLDPARLAVLADALEEAGCTSPDLLGHLRGPGQHVRGCWVVDLLLGKD